MQFVIVPGIDDSDAEHWQSIWQAEWGQSATRIAVASWTHPDLEDWCDAIERAVRQSEPQGVILIAHSLGCLATARWLARRPEPVGAVFLVAPPDSEGESFPSTATTFVALPAEPVRTPGLVVSSDNDPYCTAEVADDLALGWGLPRVSVGPFGHLNSASGLGEWDQGRMLLTAFLAGGGHQHPFPRPGLPG